MVFFITKKLLNEKNTFSKIWLAAHWGKKLNKYQIYSINIENTVKQMISEEIILDLRISGHLLFGIVTIFSRKTMYLLNECNSIFSRVNFYSHQIDLPEQKKKLPHISVTLPDVWDNFNDFNSGKMDELLSSNQSRAEDITLKETYNNIRLIDEEFDERFFCDMVQGTFDDMEEDANLLSLLQNGEAEKNDINCNGVNKDFSSDEMDTNGANGTEPYHEISDSHYKLGYRRASHVSESGDLILIHEVTHELKKNQKIKLLLEPLPISSKSSDRSVKRKRKLIIDEVKILDEEKLQNQLRDTQDITVPLDLAPPSKRLMTLKKIGGTNSLLHLPGLNFNSKMLLTHLKRTYPTQMICFLKN